jgi:hypothetical protein
MARVIAVAVNHRSTGASPGGGVEDGGRVCRGEFESPLGKPVFLSRLTTFLRIETCRIRLLFCGIARKNRRRAKAGPGQEGHRMETGLRQDGPRSRAHSAEGFASMWTAPRVYDEWNTSILLL